MSNIIKPIIKLTEICNYDCAFCRYSNHKQSSIGMNIDMVKKILFQSAEFNRGKSNNVKVIFHGGEPLLWGIDNFKEIYNFENDITTKTGVKFRNSVQTNASLINDEWLQLFIKDHTSIGISIDGPIELNEHHSKDKLKSYEKTISVIKKIKLQGGSCGILSVITNKHIKSGAKVFYDFLINNGVDNCGLCYCYNPEDGCSVNPVELATYLTDLFDLYFTGKTRINIREFNGGMYKYLKGKSNCCSHNCRSGCGDYLTFLPSGEVFFCDAYDVKKENSLGNILNEDIDKILKSELHKELTNNIQNNANNFCKNCEVRDVCGFGCPRTDLPDGNGNYFCYSNKVLYSHIIKKIKESNVLSK